MACSMSPTNVEGEASTSDHRSIIPEKATRASVLPNKPLAPRAIATKSCCNREEEGRKPTIPHVHIKGPKLMGMHNKY